MRQSSSTNYEITITRRTKFVIKIIIKTKQFYIIKQIQSSQRYFIFVEVDYLNQILHSVNYKNFDNLHTNITIYYQRYTRKFHTHRY